jgi:hypothetical protein
MKQFKGGGDLIHSKYFLTSKTKRKKEEKDILTSTFEKQNPILGGGVLSLSYFIRYITTAFHENFHYIRNIFSFPRVVDGVCLPFFYVR